MTQMPSGQGNKGASLFGWWTLKRTLPPKKNGKKGAPQGHLPLLWRCCCRFCLCPQAVGTANQATGSTEGVEAPKRTSKYPMAMAGNVATSKTLLTALNQPHLARLKAARKWRGSCGQTSWKTARGKTNIGFACVAEDLMSRRIELHGVMTCLDCTFRNAGISWSNDHIHEVWN